jgi:hypothetical protein
MRAACTAATVYVTLDGAPRHPPALLPTDRSRVDRLSAAGGLRLRRRSPARTTPSLLSPWLTCRAAPSVEIASSDCGQHSVVHELGQRRDFGDAGTAQRAFPLDERGASAVPPHAEAPVALSEQFFQRRLRGQPRSGTRPAVSVCVPVDRAAAVAHQTKNTHRPGTLRAPRDARRHPYPSPTSDTAAAHSPHQIPRPTGSDTPSPVTPPSTRPGPHSSSARPEQTGI